MLPTYSEIRAPQITRLRMSRPNSSVPSQWSVLGGSSKCVGFISSGSNGESSGAQTAAMATAASISAPASASRLCISRRHSLALTIVNLGIQVGVQDVHRQVDQHEAGGDEQHARLNDRVVTLGDAIQDQRPESR